MTRVSFQGERGAYSEGAARRFFGEHIDVVPCRSFKEAMADAASGNTDHAILPVENSIEGNVGESYDLLHSTSLNVTGEINYPIRHCLIGTGSLDGIESVYSHPQALGQCRRFIEGRRMKPIAYYDTAGSVKKIRDMQDPSAACIASRDASSIYGIPIIRTDIADNPDNYTRFLALSTTRCGPSERDKTSIIFSVKHESGALFRAIRHFHDNGINLTKIESRPNKTSIWEYNFYVDFDGHESDPIVRGILEAMKGETVFLKVLGSYPAAR